MLRLGCSILTSVTLVHHPPSLYTTPRPFIARVETHRLAFPFHQHTNQIQGSLPINIEAISAGTMDVLIHTGRRSIVLILFTVLVTSFGFLYQKWQRHMEIQSLKQQHGCKDPPKYPHEDKTWGSDMVQARGKAMKEGRFYKLYDAQFAKYGRTFEEIWRGKRLINTIEPANAQKIAALAFDDYGKDPQRQGAQAPFLGPSILWDGPIWKHTRPLVKPIFARAELSDFDHMAVHASRFLSLLPTDGKALDVQPLIQRLVSTTLRLSPQVYAKTK